MSTNVYSNRVIAFVDLLGFTTYVEESSLDSDKAFSILDLMNSITNNIVLGEDTKLSHECNNDRRVIAISDSIILSYPVSDEPAPMELFNIFIELIQIQLHIMNQGWLCRGGLSMGRLHHSGNTIFGEAYLSAYQLEGKAKTPRIIIDTKLHKYIQNEPYTCFCKKDTDGFLYIDYLSSLKCYSYEESVLSWAREKIEKYRNDDRLKDKYLWLEKQILDTYSS